MGNGNVDVGNETAIRKPGQPKPERVGNCGAMAQQRCDSGRGHESSPQKFVHLVGYRDPKSCDKSSNNVRNEPWTGPNKMPVKR